MKTLSSLPERSGALWVALLSASILAAQQPVSGPIIQTFAGADFTFQSENRPAISAPFGNPQDVNVDAAGNIYFVDVFFQAFRVNPDGTVRVLAGNGFRAIPADGVDARNSPFRENRSVGVGPDGSLYIGTTNFIKRILPSGVVAPVGGNATAAIGTGDGGPATAAAIGFFPFSIIFDSAGNLIFADASNHRIRKIDTNGIISTIAGTGQNGSDGDAGAATSARIGFPRGVRFDRAGNLFISDSNGGKIRKISGGVMSTFASGLSGPAGLDFDSAGNLYVAELGLSRISRFTPDGTRTTYAGTGVPGFGGDGGLATAAQFNEPLGIRVDANGNLLVADSNNGRVRRISAADRTVSTIAGNGQYRASPDGAPATLSFFQDTCGLAISPAGLVHVSDRFAGSVYRIEANGTRTRVAGIGTSLAGGNGPSPALSTGIGTPQMLSFDRLGNLYIADDRLIRRVTPGGVMTTIAGGGTGNPASGGLATSARLNPQGVLADIAGNIYISEIVEGTTRISRVNAAGQISVLAGTGVIGFKDGPGAQAQFSNPSGMAIDGSENLYVGDQGNNRVRKVAPDGTVSTFAGGGTADPRLGGAAIDARIFGPSGLTFDAAGGLLIAAQGTSQIFRVSPDGNVSHVAGDGLVRFAGDGGPATLASFNLPRDVAVDPSGNIYISDSANARVRVLPVALPTIGASPTSLSFTVRAGDPSPAPQQVAVAGSVAGLPFTIRTSAAFISATVSAASTPSTVSITVIPGTLAPGNYVGSVTITAGVARVAPVNISVSLTVQNSDPPQLGVDSTGLSFAAVRAGGPTTRRLQVLNRGGGVINFNATAATSSGGSWLAVTPASGTVTPAAPVSLTITATPGTLLPNTYAGSVTVTSGAISIVVPVTMSISNSGQSIRLSQSGITFVAVAAAGVTPPQNVAVQNTGQGSFSFTTRAILPAGFSWLSVSPANGISISSQPAPQITIAANPAGLAAGDYFGRIQVSSTAADNSPQSLIVVLRVLPAGTDPGPVVQPSGLVFTGVAGGGDPASQQVSVTNLTTAPLTFGSGAATLDGGNYIQYLPTTSTIAGSLNLVVQPSFAGLAAGVYRGAITLIFSQGSIQTIGILIVIAPAGTVISGTRGATSGCTPKQLLPLITSLGSNFNIPAAFPTPLDVKVVDDCGAPATSGSVVSSFSNGDLPLTLAAVGDGTWSGTWVNRNTAQRSVSITATAEIAPQQLRGSIQTSGGTSGDASPPLIGSGGIVSASSFAGQAPLAPGAMVSIYGLRLANGTQVAPSLPLGTQLAGTNVVVGGVTAPLLFSSDGQVNALLPLSLPVNARTQVIVQRGNQFSVPEEILIAPAQPGVFSTASSGKGQGHIYVAQANGTLRLADTANPARAGDTLVIYCSGLGAVDSAVTDGAAAPLDRLVRTVNPATATIGGVNANVGFAGLAPGFAVGLYQVNVTVPSGVTPGDSIPLVLSVAGQLSPTVTLAIR